MPPPARYGSISDLPQQLPVFPLQGVILLPRAVLPLNIFEPRYLAMVEDAIRGDRLIGIVQPSRAEAEASPQGKTLPLRRTGCAGRITAFQETGDGRITISLAGVARFDIVSEQAGPEPYRICRVNFRRFGPDLCSDQVEDRIDREHLLAALRAYLEATGLQADWKAINRAGTEQLVNTLSIVSPFGPEEKQALLEASDLAARAQVLMALAEMEVAARGDGSGSALQ